MKRVVILGGSGFIGSNLSRHLSERKVEVLGLSSSELNLDQQVAVSRLVEVVRKDDTVVFASCITRDKGSDDLPTLGKNLAMAEHVGLFLEKRGCHHLVYISSDAVYKEEISLLREESAKDPRGLYGITHRVREEMMEYAANKAGVPLTIVRPCAVYGPRDTHSSYGPNRFLRTALSEGRISLFGEGEEQRDHLFVGDLCRHLELILTYQVCRPLNLATGQSVSFRYVAKIVARVVKRDVLIVGSPRRTPILHRHFDTTALLQTSPSFQFVSLEEGLQRTLKGIL